MVFYDLYDQEYLEHLAQQHPSISLQYLLKRFGKDLYNVIFWMMDMTSDPQEVVEAFSKCHMHHIDWVFLILFLEDHYQQEAIDLCVKAARISLLN